MIDEQGEKVHNDIVFRDDLESWERLPNEPPHDHDVFRQYLYLGPDRTIPEAYRQYLIKTKKITPAEPCPEAPKDLYTSARRWSWPQRALDYDQRNWQQEYELIEASRLQALQEMIARHIEGYQIIQQSAIQAFFEVGEDGTIEYDEFDRPKVKPIEDINAALRAYKHATAGERTARGLPTEFISLSAAELQQRYVQVAQQLQQLESGEEPETEDEEIVEGEYSEVGK